jgi:hypothetical protein
VRGLKSAVGFRVSGSDVGVEEGDMRVLSSCRDEPVTRCISRVPLVHFFNVTWPNLRHIRP